MYDPESKKVVVCFDVVFNERAIKIRSISECEDEKSHDHVEERSNELDISSFKRQLSSTPKSSMKKEPSTIDTDVTTPDNTRQLELVDEGGEHKRYGFRKEIVPPQRYGIYGIPHELCSNYIRAQHI